MASGSPQVRRGTADTSDMRTHNNEQPLRKLERERPLREARFEAEPGEQGGRSWRERLEERERRQAHTDVPPSAPPPRAA
jgi:hypothetical protein